MRSKTWLGVLAGALTACAWQGAAHAGQPPPIDELYREEEPGPPRPRAQLFVSPAGQPFRAAPGQPYPVGAWFAQADADHDGRLTRDEFRADADAWFKVVDADANGQIGMIESTRWEEELVPEISRDPMGSGIGRRGPPKRNELDTRRQGAAAYSLVNEPHPVRGGDADFSMTVSAKEWRAATDRRFVVLDPDGDGVVLPIDLKPTPAQASAGQEPRPERRPPIGARRPSSGG
jgi:hypothetical protein